MPIFEFKCSQGHITEELFLTFDASEGVERITCRTCRDLGHVRVSHRITSVPGAALLLGDGWSKPGALGGKPSTRGGDPSKAAKEAIQAAGGGSKLARAMRGAK